MKTVFWVFILFIFSQPALAEGDSGDWMPYCKKATTIAVDRIKPLLPESIRSLAGRVIVVEAPEFNAAAYSGKVFLLLGVCFELARTGEAWAWVNKTPSLRPSLALYSKYLATVRVAEALQRSGKPLERMRFDAFVKQTLPAFGPANGNRDLRIIETYILDGLVWLLSHEFGHHALGHLAAPPESNAKSRRREHEADDFALDIMNKLGFETGQGFGPLFQFMASDAVHPNYVVTKTHPRSECRMERMLRKLRWLENVAKEPGGSEKYKSYSGLSLNESIAFMDELREDCRNNP
jgi:hypothetical protein